MNSHSISIHFGTYSHGGSFFPGSTGKGILSSKFNLVTGKFSDPVLLGQPINPAWIHIAEGHLFAASETFEEPGFVHGFDIGADGSLNQQRTYPAAGRATCHITTDAHHLYATSYLDGLLAVYPRNGASLGEPQIIRYSGSGPNRSRQESAHAHQAVISPDGRFLYVCDLGTDSIYRHEISAKGLGQAHSIKLASGCGPRHLVMHPSAPWLWVACELEPIVCTLSSQRGELGKLRVCRLPGAQSGTAAAIRLHPSGKLLGVSERVTHSICLFAIHEDGSLSASSQIQGEGRTPRDFAFTPDGQWLVASFQDSHLIESYRLDADLQPQSQPADRLQIHSPACVAI
ncbi:MAG: beta-propeller fold lactonase family protein [Verrucomicrobiota bacterium]